MNKLRHVLSIPRNQDIAFLVMLCIGLLICCMPEQIGQDPTEPHMWRTSDCISITDHYAKGNGFLQPEMNCQLSDNYTSGKTVAEFPIVYYIIGKIWAIAGKHYWMYRLFTMLFSLAALIVLYRIAFRIIGNWFWASLVPMLLLASPLFVFYGAGFLTNIYALDLNIIAAWFFIRYIDHHRQRDLLWCSLLVMMAGLLKASALILYVVLLLLYLYDASRSLRKKETKMFTRMIPALIILLIPLVINVAWYRGFVEYYCNLHAGRYSFTSAMPVWTYSVQEQIHNYDRFREYTMLQIYPTSVWLLSLFSLAFLLFNFRKTNRLLLTVVLMLIAGEVCFALLFYFALDGHDYYFCDALLFFVLIFSGILAYLAKHEQALLNSRFSKLLVGAFLLYLLAGAGNNLHLRIYTANPMNAAYDEMFATKTEITELSRYSAGHRKQEAYKRLRDELDKRGYNRNTKLICANDVSFNTCLNMLERPGYTNLSGVWCNDEIAVDRMVNAGAELLLVEDPESEMRKPILDRMGHEVFHFEYIGVYDLRPYRK